MAPHLIGRDDDVAALFAVLDSGPRGQVVVISGVLGSGKTAMLEMAERWAGDRGVRVLRISGSPQESATAYSGLHQLRDELGDIEPIAESTDPSAVAQTLLDRLDAMPPERAFLVCIDDAHWLDEPSRRTLLFAARRWSGRPLTVVLTLPEGGRLPGLTGQGATEIPLRPLTRTQADMLLDQQRQPPLGLLRSQIRTAAGGNPAALIGFSAAAAAGARSGLAMEPLPLPPAGHAQFAWHVDRLPIETRRALLTVAAAAEIDLRALTASAAMDLDALAPAEVSGVLRVGSDGLGFVNPLIRSVAYYRVPLAARLDAHRRLAEALTAVPDRQVWHAAHAVLAPDDELAARLEATRSVVLDRDGQAAAAAVMQRAAELTQDRRERTRRLLEAAGLARRTEDLGWAAELSRQALLAAGTDAERVRARTELGWALSWRDDGSAIGTLLDAADLALHDDPQLAWSPLRAAASLAFFTDEPEQHDAVLRTLRDLVALERAGADAMTDQRAADAVASLLWIRAAIEPQLAHLNSDEVTAMVARAADPLQFGGLAGAAWLGGQPDVAIQCLRNAWAAGAAIRGLNSSGLSWMVLAGACIDSGRWDEALRAATELAGIGGSAGQLLVASIGDLVSATVAARRGDADGARQRISAARHLVDPKDNRAVAAWSAHVSGVVALATNDGLTAYSQLGTLFSETGAPLHRYLSYLALADYAEAAVLAGRTEQLRGQLPVIVRRLPQPLSPRLAQLIAHATAVVDPPGAGAVYTRALADDTGERWPFDRARLRIGYASWLRRQRRRNDAQDQLIAALAIMERLRAEPWIEWCTRELRASGVRSADVPDSATAGLSPQEHQVVYLVSQGLTNPQIAARLHLSARTVSGHLYRSFPKLGVTRRNQIRDIEPPPDFQSG